MAEDTGYSNAQSRRLSCPRHGEHDAAMHVSIFEPLPTPSPLAIKSREVVLLRRYCMHCYVEVLDKLGVRDMDPVGGK